MTVFALALAAATAAAAADRGEIAPPSCDYGTIHPDAPPEAAQFDFLIGDYPIAVERWAEGAWQPIPPGTYGPARWNGRWALGGMAIADE